MTDPTPEPTPDAPIKGVHLPDRPLAAPVTISATTDRELAVIEVALRNYRATCLRIVEITRGGNPHIVEEAMHEVEVTQELELRLQAARFAAL